MVEQGGVGVDGERVGDIEMRLAKKKGAYTLKVGKRKFMDVVVK